MFFYSYYHLILRIINDQAYFGGENLKKGKTIALPHRLIPRKIHDSLT